MKNVHWLTWLGLATNVLVMCAALVHINEDYLYGYGMDTVSLVFSLVIMGGMLLQIIGLAMLTTGDRAGCMVGIIGAALFVPIGLICAFGFILSRNRMDQRAYEVPPSETPEARPQPVAVGLDAAAVKPLADAPAPAPESVQAKVPLVRYAFANQAWCGYLLIVMGIVGIAAISSLDGDIPGILFMTIAVAVPIIIGHTRAAKLPVFALYDDYLEFTPNLYASSLQIPYADIVSVDMKRKGAAKMEVRRPDGSIDKKVRVPFSYIRGGERDHAREQFRRKMEELRKLQ